MRWIVVVVAVLLLFTMRTVAHADAVYTYSGAEFTDFYGRHTPGDRLTGTITFAEPLAPNLHPSSLFTTNVLPVAFSFSDGVQTITQNDLNGEINTFSFATDSMGMLTAYYVAIGYFVGPFCSDNVFFDFNVPNQGTLGESHGSHCDNVSPDDADFGNTFEPGVLAPITATPEPSSFALFSLGLLGTAELIRNHSRRLKLRKQMTTPDPSHIRHV